MEDGQVVNQRVKLAPDGIGRKTPARQPRPFEGVLTLSNGSGVNSVQRFCSSGDRCGLPQAHRFGTKLAKCLAGNQMTLDVEGVVDGGVGREKSLR